MNEILKKKIFYTVLILGILTIIALYSVFYPLLMNTGQSLIQDFFILISAPVVLIFLKLADNYDFFKYLVNISLILDWIVIALTQILYSYFIYRILSKIKFK